MGGTGGEHGHSRDTITQVGRCRGSLKSPEIILLWSQSVADTALPARPTKSSSSTTMGNRITIIATCASIQEASSCSLSSSAQRTPLGCQPGDHPAPLGLPRDLQLSGAQLLSGLTKEQQICYSQFIFLLALELL